MDMINPHEAPTMDIRTARREVQHARHILEQVIASGLGADEEPSREDWARAELASAERLVRTPRWMQWTRANQNVKELTL